MDRTRRHHSGKFRTLIWRSAMGFYSKSIRFEQNRKELQAKVG
uniref:Transcription factor MYB1-2 n=1 Tax=Brassica juncea var. tumida TaxID=323352 RepID=V5QQH1_BRAJU|nr:transcription factor MYB1-2 [Brassica juncea var. tumida]